MARLVLAIVGALCVTAVQGGDFLAALPESESLPANQIDMLLVAEQSSALLNNFKRKMEPLFKSMPKNEFGRLEPSVVRYTLHRYFAQEFGWHFNGLGSSGDGWNTSTLALSGVMKDRVPTYIEGILHSNNQQGLGLEEVAIFAASLLDLVHGEVNEDLEGIYTAFQHDEGSRQSQNSLKQMLKAFLMLHIKGIHRKHMNTAVFEQLEEELVDKCYTWEEAKMWMQDESNGVDQIMQSQRNPFLDGYTLDQVVETAQALAHNFGKFQDQECRHFKEVLVDLEDEGTGRVPLSRFYKTDRDWPFYESVEYLRDLGALDETDASRPTVVIPNYLGSFAMCANPSKFYKVCCMDECEGLLAHVERAVGQPEAPPTHLVEVVSNLHSDTVEAPRVLSSLQISRLESIAKLHDGRVPLHGRLFAQWMHHAYPRECRYPHLAGTTKSLTHDEFNGASEATDMEMASFIAAGKRERTRTSEIKEVNLPWSFSEELIISNRRQSTPCKDWVRFVMLVVALLSASIPALKTSSKMCGSASYKAEQHHV